MDNKVTVLILTQNSGKTLKRTLESVKSFEEIVIIDGGSTDNTREIAENYPNAKFISNPWPGFNKQRNFSLTQATHDWCFMIDSDEACTPELVKEIRRIVSLPNPKKLYRVLRTEYLLGKEIKTGIGRAQYQERLFQKKHISYGGGVHHTHLIDGVHAGLDHPDVENIDPSIRVLHNPNNTLDEIYPRLSHYSIEIAKEKLKKGRKVTLFEIFLTLYGYFFSTFKWNWREGKRGVILSLVETLHRTLIKLYMYQEQNFKVSDRDYSESEGTSVTEGTEQ